MNEREVIELEKNIILRLVEVNFKLDIIYKEIYKMATNPPVTQAQFDAGLATFQTSLSDGLGKISTAITDLINKINAGTPADLTNELTAVNQMAANLKAAVDSAVADDPGPTPPPIPTPVTPTT